MTMGYDLVAGARAITEKCNKPAKFEVPNPQMGVKYVCGIHARSLDKMYKRTGQNYRCAPL